MKHRKGFTLIELLVVIAIIGLLSSVVLASLASARKKARDGRRIADIHQIMLVLELYFDDKGYYPGVNITTPGCSVSPCWDINRYNRSDGASWTAFAADLAPYISRLPIDPINTAGCFPWVLNCFNYAYGNVGRNGVNPDSLATTTRNVYDLVAQLEDTSNPQACKQRDWKFASGVGPIDRWCIAFGGLYPDGIYDPSPN